MKTAVEEIATLLTATATAGFLARWTTFTAILLVVGAVVFRFAVVGRAAVSQTARDAMGRRAAVVGALGAAVVLPAGAARLFVQTEQMRFPNDPWFGIAWRLAAKTSWGHVWMSQAAVAVLLVIAFGMATRRNRFGWPAAVPLSVLFAATPSLASHAMSEHANRFVTVPVDLLHIIGAGAWIGTLTMLFVATRAQGKTQDARAGPELDHMGMVRTLVPLFSPIALIGAALVVASGVVSSLADIESVGVLTRSLYGRVLIVKVGLVALVLLFGWHNWRHITPRLSAQGPGPLSRSIARELIVAAIVLAVTAALVVTPPPMDGM